MIPLIKREASLSSLSQQQQQQQMVPTATVSHSPLAHRVEMSPKAEGDAHCALAVTLQPPQKWYKDQFGRKATFDVRVQRVGHGCAACAEQRHLTVQLLYENGCAVGLFRYALQCESVCVWIALLT